MKPSAWPLFTVLALAASSSVQAASRWWDGATGGTWGTVANWSDAATGGTDPLTAPGAADLVYFNVNGTNSAMTVNLGGPQEALGINNPNTGGTTVLQAGGTATTLTIGASGINVGAGGSSLTIGATGANAATQGVSVVLAASQTWSYSGSGATGVTGIVVNNGITIANSGAHTLTLAGTTGSNPNNAINGIIGNGNGTLSIIMAGASNSRWNLNGVNTYTGVTTVTSGGLGINNGAALGATGAASKTVVAAGASLFLRTGITVNETIEIAGRGIADVGALRSVANTGSSTWTAPVAAATTNVLNAAIGADEGTTFTFTPAAPISTTGAGALELTSSGTGAATMIVNGGISGTAGVLKTGNTAMNLTFGGDAKSYSGATTISVGALALNTNLTGTSSLTVAAGARLLGNGSTINTASPVTVNGSLTPGVNFVAPIIGTMSMGALTLGATSSLLIDINSSTLANDVLNVTSLSLGTGSKLLVNELQAASLDIGQALLFIKNSGTWTPANGVFTYNGTVINNEAETFVVGSNTFQIKYDYDSGGQKGVALIAVVPEPATVGLAAIGVLALGLRRRRQA